LFQSKTPVDLYTVECNIFTVHIITRTSDVNKDLTLKAKDRTKDSSFKAKARTKDLTLKAKASRPRTGNH